MTPEERAYKIDFFCGSMHKRAEFQRVVAKAIKEAVAQERERCAKLVCGWCAAGWEREGVHHHNPRRDVQPEWARCEALKIWGEE